MNSSCFYTESRIRYFTWLIVAGAVGVVIGAVGGHIVAGAKHSSETERPRQTGQDNTINAQSTISTTTDATQPRFGFVNCGEIDFEISEEEVGNTEVSREVVIGAIPDEDWNSLHLWTDRCARRLSPWDVFQQLSAAPLQDSTWNRSRPTLCRLNTPISDKFVRLWCFLTARIGRVNYSSYFEVMDVEHVEDVSTYRVRHVLRPGPELGFSSAYLKVPLFCLPITTKVLRINFENCGAVPFHERAEYEAGPSLRDIDLLSDLEVRIYE